jgi:amidase
VSRFGILPLAPDFDVPGPMVRSVTDAALMLGAIAGPDGHDPATAGAASHLPPGGDYTAGLRTDALKGARLAYSQDAYDSLDDEHRALFDAGIERAKRLGAEVVAVESMRAEYSGLAEIGAIPNEFKASLNRYLAEQMPNAPVHSLSEIIAFNDQHPDRVKYGQGLLQASDATPGQEELFGPQAGPSRESARQTIDAALEEGQADAILTPGNAHANVGAAAGYPTVIEPLGYTDGGKHPFGIGFLGRAYSEPALLGFAYAYEQDAHARVAPDTVNAAVGAVPCADGIGNGSGNGNGNGNGGTKTRRSRPFRVVLHFHGHRQLRATALHPNGHYVLISVRRGRKLLLQRYPKVRGGVARMRMQARRRGLYRVTAFDPGPPSRTARAMRRIR